MNEPANSPNAENIAERQISSIRIFEAPRDVVFKMWTEPKHIERWWGPRGFRTTTASMEFRVNGLWTYTMHGPDGTDYPNQVRYLVIDAPRRLIYDHGLPGEPPMFHVEVNFEETPDSAGKRTRLSMCLTFPTKAERDATVEKYGAAEGLDQTLDRLRDLLADSAKDPA